MPGSTFPATPAQTARYWQLRRALQARFLRRKPTVRERAALEAAALILTRLEFAMQDANTTADMLAKLTAASNRAQRALAAVAGERTRRAAWGALEEARP